MMEAMALGKPVIATGYSGNLDFMDDSNSLLVSWEYTRVTGCYDRMAPGAQWAEPNIDEAVGYLKLLYRNPQLRSEYGRKAMSYIEKEWSTEALSSDLKRRLDDIYQLSDVPRPSPL